MEQREHTERTQQRMKCKREEYVEARGDTGDERKIHGLIGM